MTKFNMVLIVLTFFPGVWDERTEENQHSSKDKDENNNKNFHSFKNKQNKTRELFVCLCEIFVTFY